MKLVEHADYHARFTDEQGWSAIFVGEPIGLAGDLLISPPERSQRDYSVGILMRLFEEQLGKQIGAPALKNQLIFLDQYREQLFVEPQPYEQRYDELNNRLGVEFVRDQ